MEGGRLIEVLLYLFFVILAHIQHRLRAVPFTFLIVRRERSEKKQAARKLAARKLPVFFSLRSRRTIRKKTGLLVVYIQQE